MTKALIRAGKWLDAVDEDGIFNREEACAFFLRRTMLVRITTFSRTYDWLLLLPEDRQARDADFNVFFKYHSTYPWYSDGIWFLTQMRRWGQITEPKPADWYHETAKEVYLPEVYLAAAQHLLEEGYIEEGEIPWDTDGYKPATDEFIDGITYDGKDPIGYLNSHKIGNKDFL